MVVDEKERQRAKKRTFSINSSALVASHNRKKSSLPASMPSTPGHAVGMAPKGHGKRQSIISVSAFNSQRPQQSESGTLASQTTQGTN